MPSRRHDLIARAVPALRKSRELDHEPTERARVGRWHETLDRAFPSKLVPGFARRFTLEVEDIGGFPSYTLVPRGVTPTRTILFVHGGGFMAPIDPVHVRYAARLATALSARVVMPDYPLAPEHTWRDSFPQVLGLATTLAGEGPTTLVGDSAGGGYALALAIALRDADGPQVDRMVLLSPWVDLTLSTRAEVEPIRARDTWLFLGKMEAYAAWWAGSSSAADLGRPEVSPGLAPLEGLPPTLMFSGTRDLLMPACRLLARRAAEAGWDLTYVEVPDLIHVYPLLPFVPEARDAWRQTMGFLR